jgi:catechol 2,3-dioxygenase-like lactoylglutathione lyase family enzyme
VRLNQVTIQVTDLERSVEFYEALGLHRIVATATYSRFTCPDGEATFSLDLVDGPVPASSSLIYFECDDLDSRVEDLAARGIRFDQEPTDQPWLWREARLRDPDGHALCLYTAGENRLHPPWRLP